MARLRSRTAVKSTDTGPVRTPYSAPRLVGQARAGDHRLGRGAPGVDADAAQQVTLDERHLLACLREIDGEEPAALAGPYHDCVIGFISHRAIVTLRLLASSEAGSSQGPVAPHGYRQDVRPLAHAAGPRGLACYAMCGWIRARHGGRATRRDVRGRDLQHWHHRLGRRGGQPLEVVPGRGREVPRIRTGRETAMAWSIEGRYFAAMITFSTGLLCPCHLVGLESRGE
jgi:hypothetical protein